MDRHLNITEELYESFKWLFEKYDLASGDSLLPGDSLIFLGSKIDRVCRYCKKRTDETTFNHVAHAFPEAIGNRLLFDYWECDACNKHFSQMAEDDFAKWTLPWRTVDGTSGKNGTPTFKAKDHSLRVESSYQYDRNKKKGKRHVYFKQLSNLGDVTIDLETHHLESTLESQPYVPMGVYKCLLKMAVAIMPPGEDIDLSDIKSWLLETVHGTQKSPLQFLKVIRKVVYGRMPNNHLEHRLYRRKPAIYDCPLYIFVLRVGHCQFQIALPIIDKSEEDISSFKYLMHAVPALEDNIEWQEQYGPSSVRIFDMSSSERKFSGLEEKFRFIGQIQEITPPRL